MCLVYAIMMVMVMTTAMVLLQFNHDGAGQVQQDVVHNPALDALEPVVPGLGDVFDQGDDQLEGGQDVEDPFEEEMRKLNLSIEEFSLRFFIVCVLALLESFILLVVGIVCFISKRQS